MTQQLHVTTTEGPDQAGIRTAPGTKLPEIFHRSHTSVLMARLPISKSDCAMAAPIRSKCSSLRVACSRSTCPLACCDFEANTARHSCHQGRYLESARSAITKPSEKFGRRRCRVNKSPSHGREGSDEIILGVLGLGQGAAVRTRGAGLFVAQCHTKNGGIAFISGSR